MSKSSIPVAVVAAESQARRRLEALFDEAGGFVVTEVVGSVVALSGDAPHPAVLVYVSEQTLASDDYDAMVEWTSGRQPPCVPIFATGTPNPAMLMHLYRLGANHLLECRAPLSEFACAVLAASKGKSYYSSSVESVLFDEALDDPALPRAQNGLNYLEMCLLMLLADRVDLRKIALTLDLSREEVRGTQQSAFRKLRIPHPLGLFMLLLDVGFEAALGVPEGMDTPAPDPATPTPPSQLH